MHFFLMHAVMHLMAALILSFFILFAASKADGIVKLFGNVLGILILVLAIAGVVLGALHMHDHKDMMGGDRMHGWGPPWMHHDDGDESPAQATPPATPAQPATPAPAQPAPATPKKS